MPYYWGAAAVALAAVVAAAHCLSSAVCSGSYKLLVVPQPEKLASLAVSRIGCSQFA
jgi:hypothetical protein